MRTEYSFNGSGFMRLDDVLRLYPISKSSWYAGVASGKYPKPVKLGPNTSAWRCEDVLALLEAAGATKVGE